MLKVNPTAQLSLKKFVGNGNYQQRLAYAQKLNAELYELTQSQMVDGSIHRMNFLANLKKLLPEDIKIVFSTYVKKFLGKDNAFVTPLTNAFDDVEGMIIRVPCRKKEGCSRYIDNKDMSIIMHETFHLFASLANPKHTARIDFSEKESKFYNNYIYTNLHSHFNLKDKIKWKKGLKEFLSTKKIEKQINFLQNCRYRLIEENLAYKEGKKYGGNGHMSQFYFFEEKIKIMEKELYKRIKKARKENRKA